MAEEIFEQPEIIVQARALPTVAAGRNGSTGSLKLNDFKSEIRRGGVQSPNRFVVKFHPPQEVQGSLRHMTLRCAYASFPGKSFASVDIHRYGYGPVEKTVHNTLYQDVQVGIILDDQGEILKIFNDWMSFIHNADSSKGMEGRYEVEYKDKYSTQLDIEQHDVRNKKTTTCVLNRSFPTMIGDIAHGWDMQDQVVILPVSFTYRDYKIKRPSLGDVILREVISSIF